jgi:hypothetical protein
MLYRRTQPPPARDPVVEAEYAASRARQEAAQLEMRAQLNAQGRRLSPHDVAVKPVTAHAKDGSPVMKLTEHSAKSRKRAGEATQKRAAGKRATKQMRTAAPLAAEARKPEPKPVCNKAGQYLLMEG